MNSRPLAPQASALARLRYTPPVFEVVPACAATGAKGTRCPPGMQAFFCAPRVIRSGAPAGRGAGAAAGGLGQEDRAREDRDRPGRRREAEGAVGGDAEAFADELSLYLDTHRNDKEAFDMYQSVLLLSKEAHERYAEKCAPIVKNDLLGMKAYSWLNDPWPWELKKAGED